MEKDKKKGKKNLMEKFGFSDDEEEGEETVCFSLNLIKDDN